MASQNDDANLSTSPLRPASEIPGPGKAPLLGWRGNLLRFLRDPIDYMTQLQAHHGSLVRLVAGGNAPVYLAPGPQTHNATIFAFGAEHNRKILRDDSVFQKRAPRGPRTQIHQMLLNNVAMTTGERQKHQRRQMMPAFVRGHLKLYYDDMVRSTEELMDRWNGKEGQAVDLFHETKLLTASVAIRTLYGIEDMDGVEELATLMRDLNDAVFSPAAMIPINLPGMPYRKSIQLGNLVFKKVSQEIERKRQAEDPGKDILSMMLRIQAEDPSRLSDAELAGNAFILFFAGYETTSLTLAWTLFLLAQHPEVAAQLLDELESHLSGSAPQFEELYKMPVLDRVIKESMRLLCPVTVFPRFAASDTSLGDYEIPAGSEVMYSPYITHRDPELFPEPAIFNPDRWSQIKPSAYQYLPFGAGPRSCMGTSFASMQLRLVLPIMIQRFRLDVVPSSRIDVLAHSTMKPKKNLPMVVRKQDREFQRSKAEVKGGICRLMEFTG